MAMSLWPRFLAHLESNFSKVCCYRERISKEIQEKACMPVYRACLKNIS